MTSVPLEKSTVRVLYLITDVHLISVLNTPSGSEYAALVYPFRLFLDKSKPDDFMINYHPWEQQVFAKNIGIPVKHEHIISITLPNEELYNNYCKVIDRMAENSQDILTNIFDSKKE